ncbi:B12-binding domain-containing radical SAM protein [Poseidonocella sedimentorum]|uniref:Radical SAM superfamily enzyme YgiQ, UPF0313 family n=1 Tax=Poseidonocella sedimentorum TaxID=871652 RepID=A0A1I6DL83_9RHOB|nr:radical SAM protein [Poseidonocella sedimentorum]SFR06225.1 Radical SAM superfamily enzyme YgiQ, UPF0313 family [Poseidonocella sedimentorum]
MTRILLISAGTNFEVCDWIERHAKNLTHQTAYVVPLHLATIAGLTPKEGFEVQIWDELVQGPAEVNLDAGYDLVGITGYSDHLSRALKVGRKFHEAGIPVVFGGAGITAKPDAAEGIADAVFLGEAEPTWPEFLKDFEAGTVKPVYQTDLKVNLAQSPPPDWDSIAPLMAAGYKSGAVETSRGCPFDCEFCDVWIKFGRKMRTKPVARVMEEIAAFERLGMKRVMFATDNFIGAPKYAKQVLRAVIDLNAGFEHPVSFTTELTLTLARDPELMELIARANFSTVFIGLESTNLDSLIETRKRQNVRGDMVEECRRVSSYGMSVVGSMIVGFDNDTPAIFDQQFTFLQEALIPIPRLNVLKALDGTDLVDRMRREGRLIDTRRTYTEEEIDDRVVRSNVMFKGMTRVEAHAGYLGLMERVWDWANFSDRIIGFIDNVSNMPERRTDPRLVAVVDALQANMHAFPHADEAIIGKILSHAKAKVPALAWNVAAMTMLQCYQAAQLPQARKTIERQIRVEERLEASGGYVMAPEAPRSTVPPVLETT